MSPKSKRRHKYTPRVEPLEPVRLLSSLAPGLSGIGLPTTPGFGAETGQAGSLLQNGFVVAPSFPVVLSETTALEALAPSASSASAASTNTSADAALVRSGLDQLDRYLGKVWYRAGIAPQQHADCTQAVYLSLLQTLGRDRFDGLAAQIGQVGIRSVLSQGTAEGPDFFRAIDTVKKRAQRERTHQPLDALDVADASTSSASPGTLQSELHEAMTRTLSPRERALIQATLQGSSPSEIASQLGLASKTVSNEKTRALQKLRGALADVIEA